MSNQQPGVPAASGPSQSDLSDAKRVAEMIDQLWAANKERALGQVRNLERALAKMLTGTLAEEDRAAAQRDAHKLAGGLGTYGFTAESLLAREIEHGFAADASAAQKDLAKLSATVIEMGESLAASESAPGGLIAMRASGETPRFDVVTLRVMSSDDAFVARLAKAAGSRMQVEQFSSAKETASCPENAAHALILFDLGDGPVSLDSVRPEIIQASLSGTIAVVGKGLTLSQRIELSRLRVAGIMDSEAQDVVLVEGLLKLVGKTTRKMGTVLAVDDDEATLEEVKAIISPHVENIATLTDPSRFWSALIETRPDMVILDLDMPDIDGVELCQVIRSDPAWSDTAVVMLSAIDNDDTVQRMFAAGADDCLTKPLTGTDVAERILRRLRHGGKGADETTGPASSAKQTPQSPAPGPYDDTDFDITVVDADQILGQLLVQSLEMQGFTVKWIQNGPAAINALCGRAPEVRSRLVMMDVDMPGINGLSVLRQMANDDVLERTKVIMLTARSTESETIEAFEMGASDHITKPFSLPVLFERVRRAMAA